MHLLRLGHRSSEALDSSATSFCRQTVSGRSSSRRRSDAAGGQKQGMAQPRSELSGDCRAYGPALAPVIYLTNGLTIMGYLPVVCHPLQAQRVFR